MRRCPTLAAVLWAWGVETGWKPVEPPVYEDDEDGWYQRLTAPGGYFPAGGGLGGE